MDRKLIKRVKNGDREAFGEIFNEKYRRELYSIANYRINNYEDARDIVHSAIAELYENIYELRNILKLKAWIMKIILNKCIDYLRTKNREVSYECDDNLIIDKEASDDFITVEQELDFCGLLEGLKNDEKDIIFLTMRGYTSLEISKILNINHNTVRTKLSRAKQKIKIKYGRGD